MILANDFFGDFARPVTPTYLKFLTILTKLHNDGSIKDCQKKIFSVEIKYRTFEKRVAENG